MPETLSPPAFTPPAFIQRHHEDREAVRQELLAGLTAPVAYTAPKYLYDALGSRLFEAITELPEYYPTRTEAAIFAAYAPAMAAVMPRQATLIDLGAGNCRKAARLFSVLAPKRYVAVDISVEFLREALGSLQAQFPALPMLGLGIDFSSTLAFPPEVGEGPRILFYPGSSIGNFTPAEAALFLKQARAACPGGGLLIGVDLLKSRELLEPAYDDALGVTAAFNRNLLPHLNQLVGSDFALPDWKHVAFFNAEASRIEMHLEALRAVTVRWPGGERRFAQGERIHTENSCKWQEADFEKALLSAGFAHTQVWKDPAGCFAVFWAAA